MSEKEDRRISQWYNVLSNSYDELYRREQSQKHNMVIQFLGKEKFKVLVDIGCGTGTFLMAAEQHYEHAVGIDLSIGMLKATENSVSRKRDLVVASSRFIPIRDKTVDCLVSVSAITSDSHLPQTIDEMTRVCSKNATVAVSVFQSHNAQIPTPLEASKQSLKISDRETLYCLRLDRGILKPHQAEPLG